MRNAAAAANAIGQEQPCRVKLRLWRYDPNDRVPFPPATPVAAAPDQAPAPAADAPVEPATVLLRAVESLHQVRPKPEHFSTLESSLAVFFTLQEHAVLTGNLQTGKYDLQPRRSYLQGCLATLSTTDSCLVI